MNDERILQMVKDVEARFPNIGDRARQAGETAIAGQAKPLGVRDGRTYYEVNYFGVRYTPSIEGGCQCPDSRGDAPTHNGKPLCFHRLAAMFVHKLAQEKIDRLATIFTEAQALGCADVRMRVRVGYTYDRKKAQANTITGAIAYGDGRRWQTFEPAGEYAEVNAAHVETEIPVTFAELHAALAKAGWRYETKNKAAGGFTTYGNEVWYFVPQDEHDSRMGGQMATHIEAVAA